MGNEIFVEVTCDNCGLCWTDYLEPGKSSHFVCFRCDNANYSYIVLRGNPYETDYE